MLRANVRILRSITLAIFLGFFIAPVYATDLRDILGNQAYENEKVEIVGVVDRIVRDNKSRSADYYVLRDNYGDTILVRSIEGYPEVGQKYRVVGVVNTEKDDSRYIGEVSRTSIQGAAAAPRPTPYEASSVPEPEPGSILGNNKIVIGLVLLVAGVIILVGFLMTTRKGDKAISQLPADQGTPTPGVSEAPPPTQEIPTQPSTADRDEIFETATIVMVTSTDTMRFLPGQFTIVSGADEGKELKLQGYPTSDGAEITFGREEVAGDRRYSHVQLKERTVSRKQAKLVYTNGKYYVINMGITNPTQVDGRELGDDERVELEANNTIRLGEVEIQYTT
jgi:hypothetical protein